jgi:hypothetical protein
MAVFENLSPIFWAPQVEKIHEKSHVAPPKITLNHHLLKFAG